jgi:predicted amino acid racemase
MFLKALQERNQRLIDVSIQLHQAGKILPDTYVIDVDVVAENARKLQKAANENNVELYFMLKQMGRNPYLAHKIIEAGIKKAVVVDFKEAKVMMENGIPIGNIGHLVQVPEVMLQEVLNYGVDHVTVFSIEKLRSINKVAEKLNIHQNVLLRVVDDEDNQYPGQYSGFQLNELEDLVEEFNQLSHVNIAGVTSFPCFLYSDEVGKIIPTENLQTIKQARTILQKHDFNISVMNTPSCSAVSTMPEINRLGGTQGEPGHALTGTTPMHAEIDLPEKPAYAYVSEVSHNYENHAYIYGGGYYRRGHLDNVLFDSDGKRTEGQILPFADSNIDYFLESDIEQPVGATAIMSFRTQIFTTRSDVALVEGLSTNKPELVGIYDSQGKYLRG